jgi:hypothetical protein
MTERLLDATEVAERLNVPVSWVRESTRSGAMPWAELGRIGVTTGRRRRRGSKKRFQQGSIHAQRVKRLIGHANVPLY